MLSTEPTSGNQAIPSTKLSSEAIKISTKDYEKLYQVYGFVYDKGPILFEKLVQNFKEVKKETLRDWLQKLHNQGFIKRLPHFNDMRKLRYDGVPTSEVRRVAQ